MNDETLVIAARNGDKVAFGQLAERYQAMLQCTARQMITDEDIGGELVQEALLQAYLSLNRLRQPVLFAAWLRGILRNLCQNHLRSQRGYELSIEQLLEQWEEDDLRLSTLDLDPYAHWEAGELRRQIDQLLVKLSPKNREAVQLFYLEQRSLNEIANQLAVSTNVIKGRLFQARQQLRIELSPYYVLPDADGGKSLSPRNSSKFQAVKSQKLKDRQRSNQMVKISKIHAIANEMGESYVLYLFDTERASFLKIWVAYHEGAQIAVILQGESSYRPMTIQLMATSFEKIGAKVEEIRVETLKEITFYAIIKVRNGGQVYELDARPSDAIGLALYLQSPIFVAEEVMAQYGEKLPQPFDESQWIRAEQNRYADQQALSAEWKERLINDHTLLAADTQAVIARSFEFAQTMNHHYVGTEHLLMGLLTTPDQPAAQLLQKAGVNATNAATEFDRLIGRGAMPLTVKPVVVPRVVNLLNRSYLEASQMGQLPCTGTHLLFAMLSEGRGMALRILQGLGADLAQLRTEVGKSLQ